MAYIMKVDGTKTDITATEITLDKAKEIVGGWVEAVYPKKTPDVVMLVDEDGHYKGKQLNNHGSTLYGWPIIGDIVVMTRPEAKQAGWL